MSMLELVKSIKLIPMPHTFPDNKVPDWFTGDLVFYKSALSSLSVKMITDTPDLVLESIWEDAAAAGMGGLSHEPGSSETMVYVLGEGFHKVHADATGTSSW